MTEIGCAERLIDLRYLKDVYERLFSDIRSSFYKSDELKPLIKKVNTEIERLEELLYNNELEDSYDQNTGRKYE